MSTTVAVVANISGEAWAEAQDGSRRPLEAGDALMAGERLITAENAQIVLDFGYGETAAFGGGVTILASAEMASDFVASQQDTVIADDSVEAALASIEQALGGAIEDAEAPAAGLEGGSSGGSSSVRLARIVESIDPAGLDLEFAPYSFNAQMTEINSDSGDTPDDTQQPVTPDPVTEPGSERSSVTISSLQGGDLASSPVQVNGAGSGMPEGTPVLVTLTDQAGNTLSQEVLTGPDGTFTAIFDDVAGLVDGPFTVRATATDPDGIVVSDAANGSLDVIAGDLSVAIDNVSNTLQTIDLSGTTSDVAPGDTVSLTIADADGNTVTTDVVVNDDGTYAIEGVDVSNLVDGPLTASAIAADRNGNELVGEAPTEAELNAIEGNLTVVVDNVDNANRSIDVSGTTTDVAPGEIVNVTITDSVGNTVTTTGIVADDGSFNVDDILLITEDGSPLVDGPLTVNAGTEDRNGNNLDENAPAGTILDATDGALTVVVDGVDNANRTIDLSGTTTDVAPDETVNLTVTDSAGNVVETTGTVAEDGTFDVDGVNLTTVNGVDLVDGPLTVTATAEDRNGNSLEDNAPTGTVLNAVDDVPVISGDTTGAVTEDEVATLTTAGTLAAAGGDTGEDQFNAETLTGTYGELAMAADGTWTYSADNSQAAIQGLAQSESLTETFTVTNADGVTTETVTITINGTDDVPVISGQTTGSVTEDDAATLTTTGALAAANGDDGEDQFNAETLTGTYGELAMAADGTWTYSADNSQAVIQDLAPGQTLTDSFTVTNVDGVTTETVTITINGTDDVPVISGQTTGTVTEDEAATLTTVGTLTAANGDTGEDQFTAETLTGTYGELVMAADGTWTYSADNSQAAIQDLAPGQSLTDSFTVTNADGVTTETVTISINGTDDVPVISGDNSGSVTEDDAATLTTAGTLTAAGGDAGENQFNAETLNGTYGELVVSENGSWTYSADNSQAAIQGLTENDSLTDSFVVTNADGVTTETVTITINGTDDVPVISGDTTGSVTEDESTTLATTGTLGAANGDAGEDQFNAETLNGTYGELAMAADGTWTYSADNSQAAIQELAPGQSLSDSFVVTNADSVTTETVTITINGTDDVPVISGENSGSVTEDNAATLTTAGTLAATGGDAGEDQFTAETLTGTYGELAMAADGSWTYSADNSQAAIQGLTENDSLTDSFVVTNADGVTTETVTITINGTDDVPVISGDTTGALTEDDAATLTTAGTLTAANGDAGEDQFNAETLTGTYGNLVVGENGTWTYSADNSQGAIQDLAPGQSLSDSFVVTNADGVTTETVTITINGTDDAPVISGDTTGSVTENDAATLTTTGTLAAADGDAGEDQFNAETLNGTYGNLVVGENGDWTYSADNSQAAIQDLAPGQTLTDSFTITNADGVTTETVTITINGTDDAPVISGENSGSVTEDDAATLTTTGTLSAAGGDTGEDQFNAETLTGTYGELAMASDGSWTYSADNNQAAIQDLTENDSLTDSFVVTNADGVTTETVTITINGTDDAPVISGDTTGSVTEDDAATLTTTGTLAAANGDAGENQFNAETLNGTYGELVMAADGTWTYSADNSQAAIQELAPDQTLTDSFTVINADSVTTETVTITINGTDDVPVISGDTTGSVTEDDAATLTTAGTLAATDGDTGEDQFNAETLTGTYGELAMAADGTWTYSADNSQAAIQGLTQNDSLSETFTVTNADGVTTETVTITINGTDDVPVISGETTGSVTEDEAATLTTAGTLAAAGGDAGEDQFTAETLTGTYGELVMAADGTWSYSADNSQAAIQDLAPGQSLSDSFVVTNADGVTTETVTITINGTDDVPVISGQTSGLVTEDDAATLTTTGALAAAGGDAGEDQFNAEILTSTYGELVMTADGTWSYSADNSQTEIQELAPGQTLTDSFTVTNADGVTTETVTITINGTDDVPVISGDTTGSVTEDEAATLTTAGTLAAAGGDAGEGQFNAETLTGTYGELAMAADGTWSYSADNSQAAIQGLTQNDSLSETFTVTNADGVTTETVTITINGTDDVPVISGQTSGLVTEDDAATLTTTGALAAAGGDNGEDQFNAETLTGTYGNLVVGENGTWTYSADNSQAAIQDLAPGQSLSDSFVVTNADGVTTETVTITINGTDDVPVISGDTTGSVNEDEAATLTTAGTLAAAGGDTGEDQFNAETLTGTYGELAMAADGTWTYSADNSQAAIQELAPGQSLTDSFTVINADGVTTETVTITINGTDDVPVISGDTTGSVTENDAAMLTTTGTLAAADGDAGEDQFNAETLNGTYGNLVVGENGDWTYSADNSQAAIQDLAPGQTLTDSFTITNADGVTTETVTITINGTDDAPVISGENSGSVTEDDAATLTTTGTLSAAGGDTGEDQFNAEILNGTYGELAMAADGTWTYSADNSQAAIQGLTQNDSLSETFTVTNADGVTTETVTITINGTDDVPVISGDTTGAVTEDEAATLTTAGTLAAAGGDAGEGQFNAETLTGTYGELAMAADGTWSYSADNSQAAIQGLTQNDSLSETFTVTNADGVTTETVTITINGTDDVPVISGETTGSVTEDEAATLTTAGTLAAAGGDAGEDQFNAETLTGTYGELAMAADGTWTYSADNSQAAIQGLTQNDSLSETFTVTNADGVTTQTVTITINGTDDVPVISGETTGSVTEDEAATLTTAGTLAAAGGDAGEDQFNAETLTGTYGELAMAADGTWTYSADNSQAAIQELAPGQSLSDSFTVTNADGVTTETVTITINGTDDVPVISGDTTGSVTEDDAATLTTTGTLAAANGDAGEDQFNAETLTGTYGELVMAADGTWTYSADNSQAAIQGLNQNDSLSETFTVTNADGVTTETVTITINGTDDAPVISGETTGSVTEDDAATLTTAGTLAATGGDTGEGQFNAETLTGTYGELVMAANGTWTYSADNSQTEIQELAPGQSLSDSFVVTNADGVTTETVTITINGTDDVPVISGQTTGAVTEDDAATLTTAGTLAATGGDTGEDQFNAETLNGTYGNLVVGENGGWTYSADNSQAAVQELAPGQSLSDSFVVTNADSVTTETVTITINGTDDVPVISGDTTGSVTEDDAATLTTAGTLAAANGDAGEDQFNAETLTGTYGELVMAADGTWTYNADNSQAAIQGLTENDSLTDSFTVTNADGVTTETVTITINGTDDVPVISGDTTGSVTEDEAATLTTTGTLAAAGGDAGEDQFNAETLTGTYGELVVSENGSWTYSADNSQAAIQGLTQNDSLSETFTVTNADGVTTQTVTITINGTDDVPVISGDTTGSVTEDEAATLTTAGTLSATGGDTGEDQFNAETLTGTYGNLVVGENGTWTYSADNSQAAIQGLTQNDSLTETFTATNADGVTTETVTITINGTDDVPVISGQTTGSVTEDDAATLSTAGTLAAAGGDAGEDQFNAETLNGTYGNLVVGENGTWTYSADNSQAVIQELAPGQSLTDSFTVTNADGVTTETVTISINGTDDVPVISGENSGSVTEDDAATLTTAGTLTAAGGDTGEDQFNAETLTGTYGELVMGSDGNWTYSADNSLATIQGLTQNDSLTDSFTVTNADGVTTETVTITINGTDDVPVISGDTTGSVTEDESTTLTTTGTLAAANGDAGEDQFNAETLTGTYGELVMAADGTWTYSADNNQAVIQDLAPGQSLSDSFVVTNADGVTTETVTITINGTDDAPAISGDTSGSVTEDDAATLTTTGTLAAAGGDTGEDQFNAETLTGTYGELVMAADGSWTYSADNSQAAIQGLTQNDSLSETFTVTNADGVTTETVTITINGTDDVPVISGDTTGSVTEDDAATLTTAGTLAATGGDNGEDQFNAETLTGTYGELAMAADGTWTYSADNSQAAIQDLAPGQSLSDSFVVTNADGVTIETVTITINGTDDVPVISGQTSGLVTEDDAATLTTTGALAAAGGDAGEDQFNAEILTSTYGELVMTADGTWSYSADNSQTEIQELAPGQTLTDSFTVTNADGVTTETVTITINGTDDVPVISGDTTGSVTEDEAATLTTAGTLAAAGGDAGEGQFNAETLTGTYGELAMAADGTWSYSADNSQAAIQGLTQNDSLSETFTVTNADGVTTETVTITINGTDDVPVISGQTSGLVTEDDAATLTTTGALAAAGGDNGEDQFNAETLTGTYGNLVVGENGTWTYSADNSQAAIQDLAPGQSLSDSFVVTNADGVTTETVTITINGTDDVPVISGDTTGSVTEDDAATLTTAGTLSAAGGDTGEDQFTAETLNGTYGNLVVGKNGGWTYTADNNQTAIQGLTQNDSLTETFTVTNADGVTTETVTITINGTDDVPVISGDTTGDVTEDDAATLTTAGTLAATGGDTGEEQFNAETLTGTYGELVMAADGTWTYNADNSQAAIQGLTQNDSLTDSFTVINADGVTTETVTITINGTDDVPVISGDTFGSVTEDDAATLTTAGTLTAAGGDTGEDQFNAETLTGTYGELAMASDGSWTYSADNNQAAIQGLTQNDSLTDSFVVTNADGVTTETVTITINGTDDVPVISGDTTGAVIEDDAATLTTAGTLAAAGSDAGEDQFNAETLTGTYGELVMGSDGSWTYSADNSQAAIQDLAPGQTLTDSFTVTNADGVTTETVTITINGTDDVPVISGDTTGSVTEDDAATLTTAGTLAATGGDAGEDQFTAETLNGTYGNLVVGENGGWTYSADNSQAAIQDLAPGQTLTDSFTVTNADGVTTETVTITINGTDDVPVISGDTTGSVTEDEAATLTTTGTLAAANGDDGEDQFNTETLTGTYGELAMAADGTWTYSADNSQAAIQGLTENDSLTDSFVVTNADGVTTEMVTITINGTDDVPVISGDTTGAVTEDEAATLTTTGTLAAANGDAGEDQFNAETLSGTYGELVVSENGSWTYSADNSQAAIQGLTQNDSLSETFTVTNADGVTTETVTITINGTDDVPVISGQTTGSVTEDDAATLTTAGTLAATGGDTGEGQFNAETLTGTYGELVMAADGTWTYSADNSQAAIQGLTQNDSLSETFTVTNADGVTTETVTITINGTDDAPVISGDTTGSVTEDDAATLTTAGTLAAANGDAGENQFNAETLTGTYGELVMAADGTWTYNADNSQAAIQGLTENDSLSETFTVTNADGVTTETVTITINGTDDVPVISGDTTGSVTEDDAATLTTTGTLAAAGGDAGEDQFNAETLNGTYGELVVSENGSWTYSADNSQAAIQELAPGQSLSENFVVTNADGVTTETVTITINGTDDVPVISGDTTGSVTEDDASTLTTTGTLAAANGDAGEDQFNAETLNGTYGNLVVGENGGWTYSADNSQAAIQELAPGQSLSESFVVTNADGVTTETVTITINGTDDVPVISGDITGSVTEDEAATLTTAGTLAAANGDAGEDQFTAETLTGTYGELVMAADGTWTYSADNSQAAIQGLTQNDSLSETFTVTNADGVTTETVTITINGTDDAPVISGDTTGSVTEDDAATLTTAGTLAAANGDAGENQFNAETLTGTYGELVMAADGTWTYNADNSQAAIQGLTENDSLSETFTVTNADGVTTETVTITINGTDDVPVISGDTTGSVTEDDAATLTTTGTLAAANGDAGEDQFIAETLTGTYGELVMAANGTWSYSADNSQTEIQELAPGQNLSESFVVTNADGVTTETVTITINGTDDVPVISGDTTGSVTEDDAATLTTAGTLAAANGDAGEDQFIAEILTGTYGELVMGTDGTWTYSADNSQPAIQELSQGQTLTETFTVTNADEVTTQEVIITINGTNEAPEATDDTYTINTTPGLLGEYYAYEEGPDGSNLTNLSQVESFIAANGADATFLATNVDYGSVSGNLGGDNKLQSFLGKDSESLSSDPKNSSDAIIKMSGELELAPGTYQFQVRADDGYSIRVNGEVVAEFDDNQSAATLQGKEFTLEGNGPHSVEIIYWDQGGAARLDVSLRQKGGEWQTFGAQQASYVVTNDALAVNENQALVINSETLLSNDSDANGDDLVIQSVQNASNGTVALDNSGNVVFTPAPYFSGEASFSYTISDGQGGSDTATVTVNVRPVANAPELSVSDITAVQSGATVVSTGSKDLPVDPTAFDLGSGTSRADLEQELGVEPGYLNQFDPDVMVDDGNGGKEPFDEGNVRVIDGKISSSTQTLSEGMDISWDYTFINGEELKSEVERGFNDLVVLVVTKPDGQKESILVDSSEQKFPAQISDGTFSYTAAETGTYQFQWLVLNGGDPYKDSSLSLSAPTVEATDLNGSYGTPIALNINAALTDQDGSERLEILISNVPEGAALTAGNKNSSGDWVLSAAELNNLQLLPQAGFSGDIALSVTATSTEIATGERQSVTDTFTVNVEQTGDQPFANQYDSSQQVTEEGQDLDGTVGNDFLVGGSGDNELKGESGNDFLVGSGGNDKLKGGSGDDLLNGGTGNDEIQGEDGNDYLIGYWGDDKLQGGSGNDVLVGGIGNDVLEGDQGADVFAWELGDQYTSDNSLAEDVVKDFEVSEGDQLDLSDLLQDASTSDLSSYLVAEKDGSDTVLYLNKDGELSNTKGDDSYNAQQSITLDKVSMDGQTSEQFIDTLINSGHIKIE
ncbi:VCBS domain-containing protein [Marinobacter apostichopi]|uniref:VCBS domain-containing protein n=1 Tax=Marinobacter apostichopi TaxID=3035454 RepID=UPI00257282A6|nr:VCBS domain-containing protein [Marinobacter sp. LA51]